MTTATLQPHTQNQISAPSNIYSKLPPQLVMGLAVQIAVSYHQMSGVWLSPEQLLSQVGGATGPGNFALPNNSFFSPSSSDALPPDRGSSSDVTGNTTAQAPFNASSPVASVEWAKSLSDRLTQMEYQQTVLFEQQQQANQEQDAVAKAKSATANRWATGIHYRHLPDFYPLAQARIAALTDRAVSPHLKSGCELLLTALMAWSSFDLFRERGWLILSFDRIVRELRTELPAKTEYWVRCLRDLVRAGLVDVGRLETGIVSDDEVEAFKDECKGLAAIYGDDLGNWWTARGIQHTRVYAKGKRIGQEQSGTNIYRLPLKMTLSSAKIKNDVASERRGDEGEGRELPRFDPLWTIKAQQEAGITSRRAGNDVKAGHSSSKKEVVRTGNDVGMTSERHEPYPSQSEMTSERRGNDVEVIPGYSERPEGENEVVPTSFPRHHDMIQNDMNDRDTGSVLEQFQSIGAGEQFQSIEADEEESPNTTNKTALDLKENQIPTYNYLLEVNTLFPGYNGQPLSEDNALNLARRYPLVVCQLAVKWMRQDLETNSSKIKNPMSVFLKVKLPAAQRKVDQTRTKAQAPLSRKSQPQAQTQPVTRRVTPVAKQTQSQPQAQAQIEIDDRPLRPMPPAPAWNIDLQLKYMLAEADKRAATMLKHLQPVGDCLEVKFASPSIEVPDSWLSVAQRCYPDLSRVQVL